jgi:DNA polymerase I-like protein with 3'-5' exonuclease and polymerase domains/uracil-DNA glycosylase
MEGRMAREVNGSGPIPAKILIVGEAPGAEEESRGIPFCGASGHELDRMLGEAGISRSEVYVTNVARTRPPDYYKKGKRISNDIGQWISTGKNKPSAKFYPQTAGEWQPLGDRWVKAPIADGFKKLWTELAAVRPNVIIPVGNLAMWVLTGRWGISKWRGSMLMQDTSHINGCGSWITKVIPTFHPAYVLRSWSERAITVSDLRRAARFRNGEPYPIPQWHFAIRPSYEQVISTLNQLLVRLGNGDRLRISFDLETRSGHIACAGISWTRFDAICIPFMQGGTDNGYWGPDEEASCIFALYRVLTHPNALVIGQNLLYDCQYTYRHWHFVPRVVQDTMVSQHAIFSDLPKGLAYLASMYCDYYVYWKDEGKDWLPGQPEDQLWHYNCLDCVYTYEVSIALQEAASKLSLDAVHMAQQEMFWPVLQAMQRGVAIDLKRRDALIMEVQEEIGRRENFLFQVLGHELNIRSSKQVKALFYDDLKLRVRIDRKTGAPSCNDEALQSIAREEPLMRPLVNAISDIRTMQIFVGTFLTAGLDVDGRMRTSYNIGGSSSGKSAPKTYRLSSSENAFGGGCNLQTIPSDKSSSVGKAKARGAIAGLGEAYQYPDLRSVFVPDPGYTFFNGDLDRADLQVVVAEADDVELKRAMKLGVDIHLMNAYILAGKEPPPLDELVETHFNYARRREPMKYERQFARIWVHGTNYGGQSRTMAVHTGRTIAECDKAQRIWFGAHPGILKWHERVKEQLFKHRFIENRFGYRWYVFDRIDSIVPEAIAWVPQSTVSIVINKIWQRIYKELPDVQVLLQVHDSLGGQLPTAKVEELRPKILECAKVVVPYPDPLVIPFSLGTSTKHWGACE